MRDLFDQWLDFQTGLAPTSRDTYRHTAAHFLEWMDEQKLDTKALTPQHIADYMADALEDNSTNVVKGRVSLLRTFFDWAVLRQVLPANPVQRALLPKLRRVKPDKVPFTYEQYQAVLREVTRPDHPWEAWWSPAVRIAWHTGLRCGDVAHLEWDSVNFAQFVITVFPRKKKAVGEKLEIPMEPELTRFLSTDMDRLDIRYVLPSMRWRFDNSRTDIPHRFRAICDAAGLAKHSFHSFRHGFVTRLLNAGVDPVTIGSMTGQTVEQISEYAHVSTSAKAAALERSRQAMMAATPTVELKVV